MKSLLQFFLFFFSLLALSQSSQSEYLEAKRQYTLGHYTSAMQSFKTLLDDKVFGSYSSFYYALSALKLGNKQQAYDMWSQTQINYPGWGQQAEVSYWLGFVSFDQEKYHEAFNHIESLPLDLKESLIHNSLSKLTTEQLEKAFRLNPDNKYLGQYLALSIMDQPYDKRDRALINELSEKFGVDLVPSTSDLPIVKKDKYAVAAVLPFMYDSPENAQSVLRNIIIWNLYQGMVMGQKELEREHIDVELFPFDTRKRSSDTQTLLADDRLKHADLIIGPLYDGPIGVVANYSKNQKINMINPLSSNSELVGDNPYSYLFRPSYETQARAAAQFAKSKFKDNKKVYIFYETDRDSLLANAYKEAIQLDDFRVVRFERLTSERAQKIQSDFTEQYEVRLDKTYTPEQIDSVRWASGRLIKSRPLRDKNGKTILDEEGEAVLEFYENKFSVREGSVGHMFVATQSNLLANNFISLVEVRSDSIGIIGYENWLDFSLGSLDQLERLGINYISPDFVDKNSDAFRSFKQKCIDELGCEPDNYHILGYELMIQVGRLLSEHGKYFQRGLLDGGLRSGIIMEGLRYGTHHDNQVVPITTLENLRLINQNNN